MTDFVGSPFDATCTNGTLNLDISSIGNDDGNDESDLVDDPESPQNWAYRCDCCEKVCEEEWWHCSDCEAFDLCTDCLRTSNIVENETLREDHILIRDTLEEDIDHNELICEDNLDNLTNGVQNAISILVNEILIQMSMSTPSEMAIC